MSSMTKRNKLKGYQQNVDNIDKAEDEANSTISDLIASITVLTARKDPLIKPIKSPKLLIRGLTELKSMIEMMDIKHAIVNQIKFLITNHARKVSLANASNSGFEGHMLHSVISGNPGTGKTSISMILSKIWMALGFVKKNEPTAPQPSAAPIISNTIVNTVNDGYRKRITDLEESQRNDRRKIDKLRELATKNQTIAAEIRRRTIKLRPSSAKVSDIKVPSSMDLVNRTSSDSVNKIPGPLDLVNKIPLDLMSRTSLDLVNRIPLDLEKEWNALITDTRELRFGFDDIIREANIRNIEPVTLVAGGLSGVTGISLGASGATGTGTIPQIGVHPEILNLLKPDEIDPYENVDPKFIVAAREDLIAEYLGQTAPKTKKVLESARGGVLFIDEAYSICNMDGGSKDKYGEECLTTINEFMSLYPDEIIIIFAGYKDLLLKSIFRAQPGLRRRIAHFFEIKDYTKSGLAKIFKRQLAKNSWSIAPDISLEKIFDQHPELIQDSGGFTEKLVFFSKLVYGKSKFDETVNAKEGEIIIHNSIITEKMLLEALEMIKKGSAMEIDNEPPEHMYM